MIDTNIVVVTNKRIRAALCLLLLCCNHSAFPETDSLFRTNYDISLTVGESTAHIHNTGVKLNSDQMIPFPETNTHKIEMKISRDSSELFSIKFIIFEKLHDEITNKDVWSPIISEPQTYQGNLGAPLKFNWKSGEIKLDTAIVVNLVN